MDTHDTRSQVVRAEPGAQRDWQWLWVSARQNDWKSLAIIPGDSGAEASQVAEALVSAGRLYGEQPVTFMNAVGMSLASVQEFLGTVQTMTDRGERVVIPVDPITQNPSAIAIARVASAALLVVRLGQSRLSSARSAVKAIGRERLLGSIVIGGSPGTEITGIAPSY